jgi:hypothetical protein
VWSNELSLQLLGFVVKGALACFWRPVHFIRSLDPDELEEGFVVRCAGLVFVGKVPNVLALAVDLDLANPLFGALVPALCFMINIHIFERQVGGTLVFESINHVCSVCRSVSEWQQ